MVHSIRYALRSLAASPAFTLVAVLSLALGIGANTAIFSLVDAALLRFLPVERPQDLVMIREKASPNNSFTNPLWEGLRDREKLFQGVLAYGPTRFNLAQGGEARNVPGAFASGSYWRTLGVQPAVGRLFTEKDDRRGCPGVAVLAYGFWQSHYGGDPAAVGKTLLLDSKPFEVIGVARAGFTGIQVGSAHDIFVPLCTEAIIRGENSSLDSRQSWWITFVGRKKPEMTLEQLNAGLEVVSAEVFDAAMPQPQSDGGKSFRSRRFKATPGATGPSWVRAQMQQPLLVLLSLTGIVLLIACANIANLTLARGASRQREVAIRLALGASRWRLIRLFLAESLLVAVSGAVAGLLFAMWSSRLLVQFMSTQRQQLYFDLALDWRVLGFTAAAALITVILFGLAPAVRATKVTPNESLKERARVSGAPGRFGLRRVLVAVQIALSVLLVAGAGLLLRTFTNLIYEHPGFDRSNVVLMSLDMRNAGIPREQREETYARMLEQLRAIPGVRSASRSQVVPISGSTWQSAVKVEGYEPKDGKIQSPYTSHVSSDYFRTMGISLIAGRDFSDSDRLGGQRVCLVNQAFVNKFFEGRNPIGKTLWTGWPKQDQDWQVIGVVEDAKYRSLREPPPPTYYVNVFQLNARTLYTGFQLRTAGTPQSVITAARKVATDINNEASVEFRIFDTLVGESLSRERTMAALSGFFGVLALLLAGVGLYGVIAYGVNQRRQEIGIRMALGARPSDVLGMVMREAAWLLVLGLSAGLGAVLYLTRFLEKLLYGITPNDPLTLTIAGSVLVTVALLAAFLPARRAARLDPTVALREE